MKIEVLRNPTQSDLDQVNILISQIAKKPRLLSMKELVRVVDLKNNCFLVVARVELNAKEPIVAMAAVTLRYIPTGPIADVEDVVTDENWRGQGISRAINQKLIDIAKDNGAKHISLYTNEVRIAANAMYQNLGYKKPDGINYYRINFAPPIPSSKEEIDDCLLRRVKNENF